MRVLFLAHRSRPYHGGAERYVWEHARAAVEMGHTAVIATTDAWDMSWLVSSRGRHLEPGTITDSGVVIKRFPVAHPPLQRPLRGILRRILPGGPDRFFFPNPFVPSMDRWISRAEGFDLVHANAMPFLLHAGHRYSTRCSVPLVAVPHANIGSREHRISPMRYFDGMQREILRSAALVVAQNRFEASVYRSECKVDPSRIMVHGSGVDPGEWKDADGATAIRALSIPSGRRIVLSMTAHCVDKGSVTLLESCRRLWEQGSDFTLVMAGPVMEDFREHLDRTAGGLPADRLVVTGYVPERLRKDLFSAASIVAAPSRLDAFGIVLLDGWMGGAPVIGCRAGGMPDIIDEGADGFLVDFGNVDELASRIEELLRNGELAERMAAAGMKKTKELHTWKRVTERFFQRMKEDGLWTG